MFPVKNLTSIVRKKTYFNDRRFLHSLPHWSQVIISECFSAIWFLSWLGIPHAKSHWSHFISRPCSTLICCFRSISKAYFLGHCEHWNFCSWCARISWVSTPCLYLNVLGQYEHLNRPFSSVNLFARFLYFLSVFGMYFFLGGGSSLVG